MKKLIIKIVLWWCRYQLKRNRLEWIDEDIVRVHRDFYRVSTGKKINVEVW